MAALRAFPDHEIDNFTTMNVSLDPPKFQAQISKPQILADFSVDRYDNFTVGRRDFNFLVDRFDVSYDLNIGMETFDSKPVSKDLDHVLRCIDNLAKPGEKLSEVLKGADVVCRRGTITRLGASKLEVGGNGWKFVAIEFEGVVFVCELERDDVLARRSKPQTHRDKCFAYWGFKFENCILKRKNQNPTAFVSTWESSYNASLLHLPETSKSDQMNLFYVAEVDGLDSEGKYVEVKTTKRFDPSRSRFGSTLTSTRSAMDLFYKGKYFNSKVMNWYLQSKLANVSTIVVGFRDDNGIVSRVEPFDIEQLRSSVRNCFDYDGCLEVAHYILSHVKTLLRANPGKAVVFERAPDDQVVHFTVNDADEFDVLTPEFQSRFGG